MIIKEKVKVKWGGRTRKHYEDLGYIYTKRDDEFIVDSDELSPGSNIRIRYMCDYCGGIYTKRNDRILNSRGVTGKDCCTQCAPKKHVESIIFKKKSLEESYPDLLKEWDFDENQINPSEVTSSSGKVASWVCKEGHKWKTKIYSRTSGTGCPVCSESKGEKEIARLLKEKGIPFIREVSFSDLKGEGGGLLRFDFAILDKNEVIKLLIEYDGPFHFGGVYEGDNSERTARHDTSKNDYCDFYGIPLYRINYHNFKIIDKELDKAIKELTLQDSEILEAIDGF